MNVYSVNNSHILLRVSKVCVRPVHDEFYSLFEIYLLNASDCFLFFSFILLAQQAQPETGTSDVEARLVDWYEQ